MNKQQNKFYYSPTFTFVENLVVTKATVETNALMQTMIEKECIVNDNIHNVI